MAKKSDAETISLISDRPGVRRPRLARLTISNFRCIGKSPVTIDLDEIVILVGENNVGKSSILKAYEVVMSHGSSQGNLGIEDFPNSEVDAEALPEIELETVIFENTPGERWVENRNGEMVVRERWKWSNPGKPVRQGWDVAAKNWSEQVPWGAPNVANSRRPQPHRIDAFAKPEIQADAIKSLLVTILTERVKALKQEGGENLYTELLTTVREFQKVVVAETKVEVERIEGDLSRAISEIFPDYKVLFDARPEEDIDKSIVLFKAGAELLMGPENGYLSKIELQGSGARRTLLWNALKIVKDNDDHVQSGDRPHVLLLDEPEICLHPSAIRDACNVLYGLPKTGNWQVMVTTHSPAFLDISRDNTTIINVSRDRSGDIRGTTVFRPQRVQLDDDDRVRLKLLNVFDADFAEFLFGGTTIVVEGDTEYTALKYVIHADGDSFRNIHIVRARGKATIVSLIKILNHFGSNYSVLHDSDLPLNSDGSPAGSWTLNQRIKEESRKIDGAFRNRVLASVPNFEEAYLGRKVTREKPYTAFSSLETDSELVDRMRVLLTALVRFDSPLPVNCVEYANLEELRGMVEKSTAVGDEGTANE